MDTSEFELFIVQYEKDIFSFCMHLTMQKDLAEDLYQDTLLKAFKMCDKIEKSNNPKSFILSIAIGIWNNYKRKQNRRKIIIPENSLEENESDKQSSSLSTEAIIEKNEERKAIRKALEQIDDKFKIPLILLYGEEMSLENIAAVCKTPKGTIKSRLFKGRELLRQQLKKEGYGYDE